MNSLENNDSTISLLLANIAKKEIEQIDLLITCGNQDEASATKALQYIQHHVMELKLPYLCYIIKKEVPMPPNPDQDNPEDMILDNDYVQMLSTYNPDEDDSDLMLYDLLFIRLERIDHDSCIIDLFSYMDAEYQTTVQEIIEYAQDDLRALHGLQDGDWEEDEDEYEDEDEEEEQEYEDIFAPNPENDCDCEEGNCLSCMHESSNLGNELKPVAESTVSVVNNTDINEEQQNVDINMDQEKNSDNKESETYSSVDSFIEGLRNKTDEEVLALLNNKTSEKAAIEMAFKILKEHVTGEREDLAAVTYIYNWLGL